MARRIPASAYTGKIRRDVGGCGRLAGAGDHQDGDPSRQRASKGWRQTFGPRMR
jgi:hypothetical protein